MTAPTVREQIARIVEGMVAELMVDDWEVVRDRHTDELVALLPVEPDAALKAVRAALPILDDDLAGFRSDTPPRLWDARGYVCLDDLHCDHDRWKDCESTLTAMAAIRDVLPPEEWEANTYAESQAAVEHFRPMSSPTHGAGSGT